MLGARSLGGLVGIARFSLRQPVLLVVGGFALCHRTFASGVGVLLATWRFRCMRLLMHVCGEGSEHVVRLCCTCEERIKV